MLDRLLDASVRFRWVVIAMTLLVAAYGAFQLFRLPIDAVPDITNKQVQINTSAPALGPLDMERLVTFPVETAMAGIPGLESTRSISRNGFSQVTVIFEDDLDIFFARQQVAERLNQARESLPEGVDRPRRDPDVDRGLQASAFDRIPHDRRPARVPARWFVPHARRRAADDRCAEGRLP